jgi:parvulin-like peptidyl-prolyl isomerase
MRGIRQSLVALLFVVPAGAAEKTVATVNGETISAAEVDTILANTPPPLMPLTSTQKKQQRLEAISLLVDDKLVRQFLRDHGPKIEPAEVEKQYAGLDAAQKAEGKTLTDYFKETGLTPEKIKDNFRMMLQLAKYIDSQITKEKLVAYHEANRDFFDKTTVRTSHIVLRVPKETPAEERQKTAQKLKDLRAEIATGKRDFASAAKEFSHCPSAPKGGDIGYICRKFQVDEPYAKAAFALKVDEVSAVVETEFGMHLIKVTDRKAGTPSKFEEVTRDVHDCYETELRQVLLAHLRKNAKIEITP